MDDRVRVPRVAGTVGLFVVVGGAYYGLPLGVTAGLAPAAAVGATALGLLADPGLDGSAPETRR